MTDRVQITNHAAVRYCERVAPWLSPTEAIKAIRRHEAVIGVAVDFGCCCIKLGSGARLILRGHIVVTVLSSRQWPPLPSRAWAREAPFAMRLTDGPDDGEIVVQFRGAAA